MDEVGASRDKVVAHGDGGEKGMPGVVTRAGLASAGRAFLCAGGVPGVAGLVAPLEESCQAGIIIAPIDSGFGFLNGVLAAIGGDFFGIALLLGAIAVTISLGVLAGWLGARVDTRR